MKKPDIYKKVGHRIRIIRKNEGISQEDLGMLLGKYTVSAISYFESGHRKIKLEELIKIAKIFNVDIYKLIEGEDLVQLNTEATKFREKIQKRSKVEERND